jgi:hypothetical protein
MRSYLQPKSHPRSPPSILCGVPRSTLEELAQRSHFVPACHRSPQRYQQMDVIPGPGGRSCKQFAAKAAIETKANGG